MQLSVDENTPWRCSTKDCDAVWSVKYLEGPFIGTVRTMCDDCGEYRPSRDQTVRYCSCCHTVGRFKALGAMQCEFCWRTLPRWFCPCCNMANRTDAKQCENEKCMAPRSVVVKFGDRDPDFWVCKNCGQKNTGGGVCSNCDGKRENCGQDLVVNEKGNYVCTTEGCLMYHKRFGEKKPPKKRTDGKGHARQRRKDVECPGHCYKPPVTYDTFVRMQKRKSEGRSPPKREPKAKRSKPEPEPVVIISDETDDVIIITDETDDAVLDDPDPQTNLQAPTKEAALVIEEDDDEDEQLKRLKKYYDDAYDAKFNVFENFVDHDELFSDDETGDTKCAEYWDLRLKADQRAVELVQQKYPNLLDTPKKLTVNMYERQGQKEEEEEVVETGVVPPKLPPSQSLDDVCDVLLLPEDDFWKTSMLSSPEKMFSQSCPQL